MIPTITMHPNLVKTMGTAHTEFSVPAQEGELAEALRQCAALLDQNPELTLVSVILDGAFVEFVFDGLEPICYS
jgi:hypothetical protein